MAAVARPGQRAALEALADPEHEEHRNFLQWVGGPFDPEYFDLANTNAALQQVATPSSR